MNHLSRRLSLLVVAAGAAVGLIAVPAPAASAATTPAVVPMAPGWAPLRCRPAHFGRDWRWDDTRRGGHWDHREFNRRVHHWVWTHNWRDDRFCAPLRFAGPPPTGGGRPGGPVGPVGGPSGPVGGPSGPVGGPGAPVGGPGGPVAGPGGGPAGPPPHHP